MHLKSFKWSTKCLVLALLWLPMAFCSAYAEDSLRVQALLLKAEQHFQRKAYAEALKDAEEALGLSERIFYRKGKGQSFLLIGKVYDENANLEKGRSFLLQAVNTLSNAEALYLEEAYTRLGKGYLLEQAYKKAQEYFEKALPINQENKQAERTFSTLLRLGTCYLETGECDKAVAIYEAALQMQPQASAPATRRTLLASKAHAYYLKKDYNSALLTQKEVLKIDEAKDDKAAQANTLNNIGFFYHQRGEETQAYQHFQKAHNLSEDPEQLGTATLINLATLSAKQGNFQASRKYLLEALETQSQDPVAQAATKNHLAASYLYFKEYNGARRYALEALQEGQSLNAAEVRRDSYRILAEIYERTNNYKESQQYYQRYLAVRDSLEQQKRSREQRLLRQDLEVEKKEKDFQLLLAEKENQAIQLRRLQLEDEKKEKELDLQRKNQELLEAALRNQALEKDKVAQLLLISEQKANEERQKQAIALLEQNQKLQASELKQKEAEEQQRKQAIALLEKENNLQKQKAAEEARVRTLEKNALIGGIVLVVIILALVGYNLYQNKKKNRLLQAQNEEIQQQAEELHQQQEEILAQRDAIEAKNKELSQRNHLISQSIQAAKTIQSAVLPFEQEMKSFFTDCFILYRPKDVVSGDFYWFHQEDKKAFVAVVDCTGHGVPGAFMSMIGNILLNNIIKVSKIEQPGEILEALDKELYHVLKQHEGRANYGMDMCLVAVEDIGNMHRKLLFAGAKRPLYIRLAGEQQLMVLEGDRKSIGNRELGVQFSTKSAFLNQGDFLYLSTDGLTDQNDFDRRKFGRKKLMEILQADIAEDAATQQAHLEAALDKHQRSTDQRDDITFIGICL
jgi:serine phosphatase RsbU (regulator of sigma subunit)/tetratricopeptide (TPR) repeat protein